MCFVIPQLSQDLIPVVYHDFELLASIVNKKGDRQMMVQMPLKNLTLEQLQQLKVYSFFQYRMDLPILAKLKLNFNCPSL